MHWCLANTFTQNSVRDTRVDAWVNTSRDIARSYGSDAVVVALMPTDGNAEKYSAFKYIMSVELGLISQCIRVDKLQYMGRQDKQFTPKVGNVLKQLAAK